MYMCITKLRHITLPLLILITYLLIIKLYSLFLYRLRIELVTISIGYAGIGTHLVLGIIVLWLLIRGKVSQT